MKKIYMIPLLQQSTIHADHQICTVSGSDGGGGIGEGEEDMTKNRQSEKADDSWGNLW